jgi:hypothetical protein
MNVRIFLVRCHIVVRDPRVSMAGNFVPTVYKCLRDEGVLLRCLSHCNDGGSNVVLFGHVQQAPHSYTGTVVITLSILESLDPMRGAT